MYLDENQLITESSIQRAPSFSPLRKAWQAAVADDSDGLDPESVFDHLKSNLTEKKKRLGALETPGFVLSESFNEPLPEDELRLWNGGK
jgi:hypothetical protein